MPPMPPPGMAGAGVSCFGFSATIASLAFVPTRASRYVFT